MNNILPDQLKDWIECKGDNDCWPFTGYLDEDGYGQKNIKFGNTRKMMFVHRFVYQYVNDIELNPTDIVRHTCDTPPCCNPNHLVVGSVKDNVKDRVIRNRGAVGETHGRAKLTNIQVVDIFTSTKNRKSIAYDHNVSLSVVGSIKRREKWKHLTNNL